tara:strand:+ start:12701 stop:14173 length:1473 start_codon:yes stop_codon:yes gene_type:complete
MKKINSVLLIILLFVLLFRVFFVFQTGNFSDDAAYYTLRNVESVEDSGKPLFEDELSYSGRTSSGFSLYYYLLAFSRNIIGEVTFKILPIILFSLLIIVFYFLTKQISNDHHAILLAVLMSGFIPLFILETLNNISLYALTFLLFFLAIFYLTKLKEKKYLNLFLVITFFLSLIHPIAILLSISFFVYLILTSAESINVSRVRKEVMLFSSFLILVVIFFIYKKAFFLHGFNVIYQNIPKGILSNFFKDINLIETSIRIGIFPIVFGAIGIFSGFRKNKDMVIILSSILLSIVLLLTFKLMSFSIGLILLGLILAILSALGFERVFAYIQLTKWSKCLNYFKIFMLLLIIVTLIWPSYTGAINVIENTIDDGELNALFWLRDETEEDSIVISLPNEGHYITSIAKRKNVMDTNFLLVENIDIVFNDVIRVYDTESQVKALQVLSKYDVRYIYLSPRAKEIYNLESLNYEDDECIREVFKTETTNVYKVRC